MFPTSGALFVREFLLELRGDHRDHVGVASTKRRAPKGRVDPALKAKRRTREKFALSEKELDERLSELPELDKLAKKYPPKLKTGEFLRRLREKYGEAAEGLRQLRFARDRLGLKTLRRLALTVGVKGAIVIATIEHPHRRKSLIQKGLPTSSGARKPLQFAALRDLEGYARQLRRRPPDRYPGPQVRWPQDLPALLRPVERRFAQLKALAEQLVFTEDASPFLRSDRKHPMPSVKMLQSVRDMLRELQNLVDGTIRLLKRDRKAKPSARTPRRRSRGN